MRAALLIASFAAVASAGFLVGQHFAPRETVRTVVVDRAGPRETVTRALATDSDAIRAVIQQELARAMAERAATTAPASRHSRPSDAASEAAFGRARALIDAALAAGVWTDDDRAAVRASISALSREQLDELGR